MSTIIVFPGQGSQKNGMAQDFFEQFKEARNVFTEASDALNLDMTALCFNEDERLNLTEYTQPAIVTAEIAMFLSLQAHFGLQGDFFAGHSLGEYTALVAAQVIPLADAVQIVRERGRRMQEAVPSGIGAMAAIIQPDLPMDILRSSLSGLDVDIANHNAPNQIVISGEAIAVQTAVERYQDQPEGMRAKIRMLTVSAPFHSRLMKTIEPGFRSLLFDSAVNWNAEKSRQVASNTTGDMHDGSIDGLVDRLTHQISGTVRWVDNMQTLCRQRPDAIIEIGPGRPLRGFFRGIGEALGNTSVDAITNLTSARRTLEDEAVVQHAKPVPLSAPPA